MGDSFWEGSCGRETPGHRGARFRPDTEHSAAEPPESLLSADEELPPAEMGVEGEWTQLSGMLQSLLPAEPLESADGHELPRPTWAAEELPTEIGSYRVLKELARGGTSVVYLCEQRHPTRLVALKLLRSDPASNPQLRQRFQLEIQLLATLNHPGIAQIYDAGLTAVQGALRPYFTMELVRGLRLNDFLETRDPDCWTHQNTLELFLEICDAVQFAHGHGIIHRDLKPSNILVDERGHPKVIDFGIARLQPAFFEDGVAATLTRSTIGTPPYMSPEQFAEDSRLVDTRSDVYSLAVVFFEALAGKLPYEVQGNSFYESARTIRETSPTPLRQVDRQFSVDLETVFQKGLAKAPDDRYASVQALADDLRRCRDGRPVMARRTAFFEQIWQWSRRHPRSALAAMASLLLLTVTSVLALLFGATAHYQANELRVTIDRVQVERELSQKHAQIATARSRELSAANDSLQETMRQSQHLMRGATLMRVEREVARDPQLAQSLLRDEKLFPPEARNFTWRLLERRATNRLRVWQAHSTAILDLSFSSDGQVVGTVAQQDVILWRASDGQELHMIREQMGPNSRLAVDHSGSRVIVTRADGSTFAWRIPEGDQIHLTTPEEDGATAVAYSRDGRYLAVADCAGSVAVWGRDLQQALWKKKATREPIVTVQFDDSGTRLGVVSAGGEIVFLDATSGSMHETQTLPSQPVEMANFDPGLRYIAVSCSRSAYRLWDCQSQQVVETVTPTGQRPVAHVLGSQPPTLLAVHRSTLETWQQGERTALSSGHGSLIRDLDVDEVHSRVAMGFENGLVAIHTLQTPIETRSIATREDHVVQLRFSERHPVLAATGRSEHVTLHDWRTGEMIATLGHHTPPVRDVMFVPESDQIITTDRDGVLRKWNWQTGTLQQKLEPPRERVRALVLHPRGTQFFGLGARGNRFLYDLAEGQIMERIEGPLRTGNALAMSPDGTLLVAGSERGHVVLWNVGNPSPLASRQLFAQRVANLSFSPDNRYLVASSTDGPPAVWEVPSLELVKTLQIHSTRVSSLDYSPDGTLLASGSIDGRIVLWDAVTWEPQLVLSDSIEHLRVIRFSPDGACLAVGGRGHRISLWETGISEPTPAPILPPPETDRDRINGIN